MPRQEEHEKPENMVESPHEAERSARSLAQAVDSNATLEGYYAMNQEKPSQELENEARQDKEKPVSGREKGHPIP